MSSASSAPPLSRADGATRHNILYVAELTALDFIRRKDLYVVAGMMSLFLLAIAVIRLIGIDQDSAAQFLMSAGLTLSYILAAILSASFFGRAFPEEFERGTLVPLLAKPVTRPQVLAGKALTSLGLVWGAYLLFVLLTLVAVPLVEGQRLGALAQVVALNLLSLALLGALTLGLSLHFPTIVTALVALTWHFGAGFTHNVFAQSLLDADSPLRPALERFWALLPDATLLRHTECFASASAPLSAGLFASLMVYALIWSAVLYLYAQWRFERIRL